ncbi:hypothetical protein LJR030_005393 [Rhizobium sp. LjRoot30]|uniref:hypothetical protein n=1 Tax=Rhizobium sp. LjRoot30 TaxID=3342320 RepID=UPI003ECF01DE
MRPLSLKAIRDQAKAARLQATLDSSGNQTITIDMLQLSCALRVEVADNEVRITGSKTELLRTLVAASSEKRRLLRFAVLY